MQTFQEFRQNNLPKINPDSASDRKTWEKWNSLINVPSETLSDSLKNMKRTGNTFEKAENSWTPDEWKSCREQVRKIDSIKRMRERMVGNPFERAGEPTKWMKSLLERGHDPRKR